MMVVKTPSTEFSSIAVSQRSRNPLKRYPLTSFFVLAYLFTWVIMMPLVLAKDLESSPIPAPLLISLATFGLSFGALIVTAVMGGRSGVLHLLKRFTL